MVETIRVLLVDDEPDVAELAARFVERENERLDVKIAASAAEGLAHITAYDIDCIVSDQEMGRTTGIEFLQTVREEYPDLPFILFTGKGSEEIASEAISAGVTEYLQKESGTGQYAVLANRIENAVERYRATRAVEKAEWKLSKIAERADDVLFMFDADWSELLFVNSTFEELWGVPVSEVREDPTKFLEYVHPEDRPAVERSMGELSDGEAERLEYRIRPPEKDQRWVRAESKPIVDDDGTVTHIVGYVRDVTERKERQRELERYERIVQNTEEGIYTIDADGCFDFVNQRVVEASGLPLDAWVGEHVSILGDLDLVTEDEVAAIERAIDSLLAGESTEERVEVTPDIPDVPDVLDLRLTPLSTGSEADRVIGFTRDITERKERERDLKRQNERLEEFASVVSHDLRNPLNVAEGQLALAREETDNERLAAVARAHERMHTLIDDLLVLAREGTAVSELEPVDLEQLIRECWANVETGEASVVVEESLTMQANPSRVKQLFENLLNNAVEHGGGDVEITVGPLEEGFYLEDDGPGIPEDRRQDVFEPGVTTSEDGTGFGLSIVKEVATAHGWDIAVTEGEHGGARFEVTGVDVAE